MGDRLGADDREDTGNVSTVTAAVNNDIEALLMQVEQASTGINAATSPSLGQGASRCLPLTFIEDFPTP